MKIPAILITCLMLTFNVSISHAEQDNAPAADATVTSPTPSIYKHVDADGNVSYSDSPPNAAAETLEMEPLGTISMPKPAKFTPTKATAAPIKYESIAITSPAADTTYQNLSEPIQVSAQLSPSLQSGHTLALMMDGRVLSNSLATQVENLERGSHVFTAQVQDANGRVLISSAPVTVQVHRNSIINNQQAKPDAPKPSLLKRLLTP